jgi:hypothetical protein
MILAEFTTIAIVADNFQMIIHFAQQDVIPHWAAGFFGYAQKTKPFTGPFQNGLVHLGNGSICYVSINHFETTITTK